jgi:hypothetical protein
VCKCVLLPPGDNPIAVNKYIISYFNLLVSISRTHVDLIFYCLLETMFLKVKYIFCKYSLKIYDVCALMFIILDSLAWPYDFDSWYDRQAAFTLQKNKLKDLLKKR